MRELIRLIRGDEGQDLIEYAFLCVFVAFAALAAWTGVRTAMTGAYGALDTNEQNLWITPDPPPAAGS
jgi:Flp pilus assembly pilin Flp